MPDYQVVGTNVPKIDAADKVTGRAKYTADMSFPGMLWGKILRSPHAHAKILSIDTERASKLPGVKAVITGQDTVGKTMGSIEAIAEMADRHPLAMGKVRFIGDEVAAVAAVSEEVAEKALKLIDVHYEVLPGVFSPEEALAPDAPRIHERESNIGLATAIEAGDVDKAFEDAFLVHEGKYRTQLVAHSALEPHAALGNFENGRVTIWTSTQGVFVTRFWLARTLGLPESRVRVIKPHIGGGFGGKLDLFTHEFASCKLSILTGRPVKIVLTREEVFIATRTRHPMIVEMKTAVTKEGLIIGKECTNILDGGAYGGSGVAAANLSLIWHTFPYKIPNIRMKALRVYTNNPVGGAMRGYGSCQIHFASDSHMDEIAEALGMDALELRRRNAMTPDYVSPGGLEITSCGFTETLEKAARGIGWDRTKEGLPEGRGLGLGASGFVSGTAFAVLCTPRNYSSSAIVKLHREGYATLWTGACDIGQGSDTTMCVIAAEILGMAVGEVRLVAADTDVTPFDSGAYGSRVTSLAGKAVLHAANDAIGKVFVVVAGMLGANTDELIAQNGRVFVKGNPERGVSLSEGITACQAAHGGEEVVGNGTFAQEITEETYRTNRGNYATSYSFSTCAAEVEVDQETGEVSVEKMTFAHDVGFPINPVNVEGQIEGSLQMGIGYALTENCAMKDGALWNGSFLEYKMPTALDMPPVAIELVRTADPKNPFGAKECGEGGTAPVAPSIANAVYNAIGVRFHELPITPEAVWKALEEKRARAKRN